MTYQTDQQADTIRHYRSQQTGGLYQFSILDLRFWIDGQQPCKGSGLFICSLTLKNWYYFVRHSA
ncbi:MAG: hypothetical protein ACFE0I_03075 [Elainellaceae cyanobacterium]